MSSALFSVTFLEPPLPWKSNLYPFLTKLYDYFAFMDLFHESSMSL